MSMRKCDICLFFPKKAVGIIALKWVSTRRYYVCEKHKNKMIEENKEEEFRDPSFASKLTFEELLELEKGV